MSLEQRLASYLDTEGDCLHVLLEALQREHDALLGANVEAMERASQTKQDALLKQADATGFRQGLLAQTPFATTEDGMRQFIATCGNQPALDSLLTKLTAMAQRCHDINRHNGRLIQERQQQAQGALNILRQNDISVQTYSGQGKTSADTNSRTLGKA